MTAILIDKFRDHIYVFADGRETIGDFITSDTVRKIKKDSDSLIYTHCGASWMFDALIDIDKGIKDPSHFKFDDACDFIRARPDVIEWTSITGSATSKNIAKREDVFTVVEGEDDGDWSDCLDDSNESCKTSPLYTKNYTYNFDALPLVAGSGSIGLKAAYFSIITPSLNSFGVAAFSEAEYLLAIKEVFLASAKVCTSCSHLYSWEKIKIDE